MEGPSTQSYDEGFSKEEIHNLIPKINSALEKISEETDITT